MKCLTLSRLVAYHNDLLKKSDTEEIKQHLQSCQECQQSVKEYRGLTKIMQRSSPLDKRVNTLDCFNDTQLLTFLEGRSPGHVRGEFYQHLAACPACTDQLIALEAYLHDLKTERLLPTGKGMATKISEIVEKTINAIAARLNTDGSIFRIPRPIYHFVGIVLILIVIGVMVDHQQLVSTFPFNTREPASNLTGKPLRLLDPTNRTAVNTDELQFSWTKISQSASYTFLLLDTQGEIIWEQKTSDFKLSLPTEIQLKDSETYFWQVECLLKQGGSIVSDMVSFSINNK